MDLANEFIIHVKDFETDFINVRNKLNDLKHHNKLGNNCINFQTLSKKEQLDRREVQNFIYGYVIYNEHILQTRKNLDKFNSLLNQNGNLFYYKGNG